MTAEEIKEMFAQIRSSISQYEQCKQQEVSLLQTIADANEALSSLAADSINDSDSQKATIQKIHTILVQSQQQLQQVKQTKEQHRNYLENKCGFLTSLINECLKKIYAFEKTIAILQQAASNQFGSNATAQLQATTQNQAKHKHLMSISQEMLELIDNALNDPGTQKKNVFKR